MFKTHREQRCARTLVDDEVKVALPKARLLVFEGVARGQLVQARRQQLPWPRAGGWGLGLWFWFGWFGLVWVGFEWHGFGWFELPTAAAAAAAATTAAAAAAQEQRERTVVEVG